MNPRYAFEITTEPTIEPVTLAEAKAHLRVDVDYDDTYISSLIVAARMSAEKRMNRQLITATARATFDTFPANGVLYMPRPKLLTVTSITYLDTAGASQTWTSTKYQTDIRSEPGRIFPTSSETWPNVQVDTMNTVTVVYTCGYGATAATVPQGIKQGILLFLGHLFENRENINIGNIVNEIPQSADYLFSHYAVPEMV